MAQSHPETGGAARGSSAHAGSPRAASARIAYVFLEPFFPHHGGYAHAEAIIRHLRKAGWQIDLFAPRYGAEGSPSGILSRLAKLFGCLMRCSYHLPRSDLAYIRYHPLSFVPVLIARALSRPIILEINGPWYDVFFNWPALKPFSGLVHWLFDVQIRLADATIGVTPQLTDWANAIAPGRGLHVSNGADSGIFRPGLPRLAGTALPERYVSFCSFLSLWQGIDTILAATGDPAWPQDIPLVIAGSGPELGLVGAAVEQSPRRVIYLGVRRQPEIAAIIANASAAIVAVTNLRGRADTGLAPIKLFEAMAAGTPVIATDLPFQREIVRDNECGLVIPVGDPHRLAQAVAEIARSPDKAHAMGQAGRAALVAHYSWERAAAKTAGLMERLLGRRSPDPGL